MSKSIAVLTVAMAIAIPARAAAQEQCKPFQPPFLTKAVAVQELHTALDGFARAENGRRLANIHTNRISSTAFNGRAEIRGPRDHQFIRLRWQVWGIANSTDCGLVVETTIVALKNGVLGFDPPVVYP